MEDDAIRLRKLVILEANTIQMPTEVVYLWTVNDTFRICQWATEAIGMWQQKGALRKQWKGNTVRGHVWEVSQSMSTSNKLRTCPK